MSDGGYMPDWDRSDRRKGLTLFLRRPGATSIALRGSGRYPAATATLTGDINDVRRGWRRGRAAGVRDRPVRLGGGSADRRTVITFESVEPADAFAREQGWSAYEVTGVRFFLDLPVKPPAGSRLFLDALERRLAARGSAR
jgi:hypothetical protein